jgi:hypothetical protein
MSWQTEIKEKIEENVNETFYQKRLFRAIKKIVKKEFEKRDTTPLYLKEK